MLGLNTRDMSPSRPLAGDGCEGIRVLLASPRGFCAGVRRAIDAVRDALALHGAPVYVLRPIVHNLEVVRTLEAEGAVFIQDLNEAPEDSPVIFSAHGTTPTVAKEAERRKLRAYDAVCPLVAKVHREVQRHQREGRHIILVGHDGHPEIEGTMGHADPGRITLIRSVADVGQLTLSPEEQVALAVQTTYSVEEADDVAAALRSRFSDLAEPPSSDICYATTNRQAAARAIAGRADAVIVVGEHFSSNACRLAEVAASRCPSVQLVSDASQIDWRRLPHQGTIGVTAAASTPDSSVSDVVDALDSRFDIQIEEVHAAEETIAFKRVAIG